MPRHKGNKIQALALVFNDIYINVSSVLNLVLALYVAIDVIGNADICEVVKLLVFHVTASSVVRHVESHHWTRWVYRSLVIVCLRCDRSYNNNMRKARCWT